MSKIGKKQVFIPQGIRIANFVNNEVQVSGPIGRLSIRFFNFINIEKRNQYLLLHSKHDRKFWGLSRTLINIMIQGVKTGYKKKIKIKGIGYKVYTNPSFLIFVLGYSHDIIYHIPQNILLKCVNNTIEIFSCDKQLVGQICADIRKLRRIEIYKGKGIKYNNEVVTQKIGKKK